MTPQELNLYAYAKRDELMAERTIRSHAIYDLAGLIRTAVWNKEFPEFSEVYPEEAKREKNGEDASDDKIYAAVRALNALMGGREE